MSEHCDAKQYGFTPYTGSKQMSSVQKYSEYISLAYAQENKPCEDHLLLDHFDCIFLNHPHLGRKTIKGVTLLFAKDAFIQFTPR